MNSLSFDIAENILGSIDSPGHLRALALTSHYWTELIIPRHIQYRKISIGSEDNLSLWAHLAERKDLAKNVREVWMTDIRQRGEQRPTTLVPLLKEQPEDMGEAIFLQAFRNFERLESFTWRSPKCPGFMDPHQNSEFRYILSNARNLVNLDLSSRLRWQKPMAETLWKTHLGFNFRNLIRLNLNGAFWYSFDEDLLLTSMLLQSPGLEELLLIKIGDSTPFTSCFFPRLRKLTLVNTRSINKDTIMEFIWKHDTIRELAWSPLIPLQYLPGSLPTLQKVISSDPEFLVDVLGDKTVPNRILTYIGRVHAGPKMVEALEQIEGSQVQELILCTCVEIPSIRHIAKLFPNVTTLEISTSIYGMYDKSIDDEILALSLFPALECVREARVWTMISKLPNWEARQGTITKLACACPNLKLITPSILWGPAPKIMLSRDNNEISWMEVYSYD